MKNEYEDAKEVLEKAQTLYNEGKWQEAIKIIDENLTKLVEDKDIAEAGRIKGWSYYYLGIKGPAGKKTENLERAENAFGLALVTAKEEKTRISAMNGLPLVLWILDKKEEAWLVNDKAIKEFPQEPSIWNTKSVLCRWAGNFRKAVKVCEKVYETAVAKGDFRTAGHGKRNKADALKELGKTGEAKKEYEKAIELYKKYEEVTGESAKFHIDGVQEKLANL